MNKGVTTFLATFGFAFIFFYGSILLLLTFYPLTSILWSTRQDVPVISPIPTALPALSTLVQPYPPQTPLNPPFDPADTGKNILRIPAINITIPLTQSASLKDADVINALQSGAAIYPNGLKPGALGNVFIAAHSTGNPWQGKFRFAFLHINELKTGDTILIDWHGTRYTYTIYKSETIVPKPGYTVPSDRPYPTLSLMACWPLWSTSHRILIHADLTNVTQLQPKT